MTAPAMEESPTDHEISAGAHPTRTQARLGRIAPFVLIVSAILLSVTAFVCATWGYFTGTSGWLVWQLAPDALVVAFVAATILGFNYSNPPLRIAYAISAAWLGVLNYAFFASIACWLTEGIALLAGWNGPHPEIAAVFFGAALLTATYGLINAGWLRVTKVTVPLPNLPEAWQGKSVALVTDVHLGHISGPHFLSRIISRLRTLRPEAVFISGDMFDGTPIGLDRLVAPWRGYSTPLGIYFIAGNHDEFAEKSLYLNAVAKTGIRVLNNEKITLDGLQIIGAHDSEASDPEELRRILREAQIDPARPSVLLSHRPENLPVVAEAGVSLQLSGHTHRGQLWPWSLLVKRIYGPFAYGLNRLGKLQVYTSSGAGTWGPPLRVGTKSEIVLIRLEKES